MKAYRTELGQVIYNPETRRYEALVSFHEDGDIERVPCALAFPMDAEPRVVAAALVRQAQEVRRSARIPLVSRVRSASKVEFDGLSSRIANSRGRGGEIRLGA
jgi:hypothetical protein